MAAQGLGKLGQQRLTPCHPSSPAACLQSMAELPVRGLLEPELASLNGSRVGPDGAVVAAAAAPAAAASSASLDDPAYAPGTQKVRVEGEVLRWHHEHGKEAIPALAYIEQLEAEIAELRQQVRSRRPPRPATLAHTPLRDRRAPASDAGCQLCTGPGPGPSEATERQRTTRLPPPPPPPCCADGGAPGGERVVGAAAARPRQRAAGLHQGSVPRGAGGPHRLRQRGRARGHEPVCAAAHGWVGGGVSLCGCGCVCACRGGAKSKGFPSSGRGCVRGWWG